MFSVACGRIAKPSLGWLITSQTSHCPSPPRTTSTTLNHPASLRAISHQLASRSIINTPPHTGAQHRTTPHNTATQNHPEPPTSSRTAQCHNTVPLSTTP